jgi:adhesin transport system outer membrane protein
MGALEVLKTGMPTNANDAVQQAVARSPAVAATIENLRAARAGEQVRRSALQPRVEARARVGGGKNYGGMDGRQGDAAVELVLNWNLFDGGASQARVREQTNSVAQAMALRDQACREVRQTAAIAYNDASKLMNQVNTLARNSAAIERARQAYRQQFEIGQRSLLDLLNAENEAYTARRALTNAVFDRALAHARTLAATHQLSVQLELARDLVPRDSAGWSAGDDAARCPTQAVAVAALRVGASADDRPLADGVPAAAAVAVPTAARTPARTTQLAAAPGK